MRRAKVLSGELAELRARVLSWREREGGGRGSLIPEELWQEAIRVARVEGLYATAKAIRFNYERLKERSTEADGRVEEKALTAESAGKAKRADLQLVRGRQRAGARFVAVQMAPAQSGKHTTIDLVGRHGDRMRVDVDGEVDVAGLLQTFWSRAS